MRSLLFSSELPLRNYSSLILTCYFSNYFIKVNLRRILLGKKRYCVVRWIKKNNSGHESLSPRETKQTLCSEKETIWIWLCIHSTKGLFVMAIAPTSHYNFWTFWTFLECFYMILINKKKLGKYLRTFFFGTLLHTGKNFAGPQAKLWLFQCCS